MGKGENSLSESSLNNELKEKQAIETAKTEASNLKDKMLRTLNLPEGSIVLSISGQIDEIPLGGQIVQPNAFAIKIQNRKREIETIIVNAELEKIATINEDNQIVLENSKFAKMIGEQGRQTEQQKDLYDLDTPYFLAKDEKGNLVAGTKKEAMQLRQNGKKLTDIRASEDGKEPTDEEEKEFSRNESIAKAAGITEDKIKQVFRIHDYETSEAIAGKGNTPSKHRNRYLITLTVDSTQKGYNDSILVEENPDGTFNMVAGPSKASEATEKIAKELSMGKIDPEQEIRSNEVNTHVNADSESNIEIMKFGDDDRTIISLDRENNVETHAFRERSDGVLEPLCVEHEHEDTIDLAHEKALIEELPPKVQELMQDKEKLEKLERIIELDSLQTFYENKLNSPDYAALLYGAAKGTTKGFVANELSGGMLPGIEVGLGVTEALEEHEKAKEATRDYLGEVIQEKEQLLGELSLTSMEAREMYKGIERVPWPTT